VATPVFFGRASLQSCPKFRKISVALAVEELTLPSPVDSEPWVENYRNYSSYFVASGTTRLPIPCQPALR
jgi:hypothetical protein